MYLVLYCRITVLQHFVKIMVLILMEFYRVELIVDVIYVEGGIVVSRGRGFKSQPGQKIYFLLTT